MMRVFAAMSGGVDSSVAAALLLEEGCDVTGITMRLRPTRRAGGADSPDQAVDDAVRVCAALGIAHETLDFTDIFDQAVIGPYADAYACGHTPNPCVECNARVKFGNLLSFVAAAGGAFLATGHYARIVADDSGCISLARARDASKDQSYFLYRLTPTQLARSLFPLGSLMKTEVRRKAEQIGLHVHDRRESQDVCFAPEGRAPILRSRRPDALLPGPIIDEGGRVVGEHSGVGLFTVGQRHGLGVASQSGPVYVVGLDAQRNTAVVGSREALAVRHIEASDVVWPKSSAQVLSMRTHVSVQTRYRMRPVVARARVDGGVLYLDLEEPVFGVAPGQAVVCYEEDVVLGGGTIERTS